MTYRYQVVERIPEQLRPGVVYHSEEFELAALLCACGCGHRIVLLVPDSHQITSRDGLATIRPSIGVFDAACKSHFHIIAGQVHWLPAFNNAQVTLIMRAQIARHVALNPKKLSWLDRMRAAALGLFNNVKSMFWTSRR